MVRDMDGVREYGQIVDTSRPQDRDRLTRLFDTEFDALYRYCLARTGDTAAADDAASEAFTAAARHFAAGRGDEIDRPWLFVVARNRMVDQWRSQKRHERRIERLARQRQPENRDQPQATSIIADHVLAALSTLPERQRAALALRYLDECSVSEVADQLDISYQAAESLLARARRSFTQAWEHTDVS